MLSENTTCLGKLINQEKPTIVLLQETKCDKETMTTLAKKCWNECKVKEVIAMGFSGSLEVLWNLYQVTLENFVEGPNLLSADFRFRDS